MNHKNPTPLRIGRQGTLGGKDFRIVGRVVMGVTLAGETYYWQEFTLCAADKTMAILVYEETENDVEWRLFTEFEPEFPMSAAEAARRQVGDQLNLNGENVRVTLVQTSRVYWIEGRPPDDSLRVDSEAGYFNAEASGIMQVVSWTRGHVEYYNGLNLTRETVEKAFKVSAAPAKIHRFFNRPASSRQGNQTASQIFVLYAVLVLILFGFAFSGALSSYAGRHEARPVRKMAAAALPLAIDTTVKYASTNYFVATHAVVEVDAVGSMDERHEYTLTGDDGQSWLLVCGDAIDAKHWILYQPLTPLITPTPIQAAAQKIGDLVNIDGVIGTVSELFQSTVRSVDTVKTTDWNKGDVRFNYLARSPRQSLLVSWNNTQINIYSGKAVSSQDFKPVPSSH